MKNVQIIEKSSGHIVAEYPIIVELTDDASDQDYIDDAWEIAVEEGLVEADYPENYDIEIVADLQLEVTSHASTETSR